MNTTTKDSGAPIEMHCTTHLAPQNEAWSGPCVDELMSSRAALLRYLRRFVRDEHLAEDLTQEVLLRGLRYLHRLRTCQAMWPWLRSIAYHTAMDFHRRYPREIHFEDPRRVREAGDPCESEWLRDRGGDLRRHQKQWSPTLHRALRFLSGRDRILLIAHYFVGLSCEQIAARARLSIANVKIRLHRSRLSLRRHLPPEEEYHEWAGSRPAACLEMRCSYARGPRRAARRTRSGDSPPES